MNTDTDGTKGDGEGQNSRKECDRRAENRREQTETDGDGRRMFENKIYVTGNKKQSLWFRGLQVLKEHNYIRDSTYCTIQINSAVTGHKALQNTEMSWWSRQFL